MTSSEVQDLIQDLPGRDLIATGLADADAGRVTCASCLISIASPRLLRAGLLPRQSAPALEEPERTLYRLLQKEDGDAFSRYNALLRQLVSFERALDHRMARR